MNILQLIQSHEELRELPFIIVFRTLQVLQDKGLLSLEVKKDGMD